MVVTCPQCSKRYMLDEALLPREGRQVRCIACQHIWRQIPDLSTHSTHPLFVGGADVAHQTNKSSGRKPSWLRGMIIFSIFIFCIIALIFGRNFIVAHWPGGEKYYELVGLQVNLPGAGLSIVNATSEIQQDGSLEMIRVMGDIVNVSSNARPIPPLKIKLVGDRSHPKCAGLNKGEDCILDHWEHRLSERSLLPGEKIHFETDPRPKIEGAQHIRVEF